MSTEQPWKPNPENRLIAFRMVDENFQGMQGLQWPKGIGEGGLEADTWYKVKDSEFIKINNW